MKSHKIRLHSSKLSTFPASFSFFQILVGFCISCFDLLRGLFYWLPGRLQSTWLSHNIMTTDKSNPQHRQKFAKKVYKIYVE